MRTVYGTAIVSGIVLGIWARLSLPNGTSQYPVPIVKAPSLKGPYRYMTHPMYFGSALMICGFAGLAAGFWNVLAVGTVAELLFREWAWRETGRL